MQEASGASAAGASRSREITRIFPPGAHIPSVLSAASRTRSAPLADTAQEPKRNLAREQAGAPARDRFSSWPNHSGLTPCSLQSSPFPPPPPSSLPPLSPLPPSPSLSPPFPLPPRFSPLLLPLSFSSSSSLLPFPCPASLLTALSRPTPILPPLSARVSLITSPMPCSRSISPSPPLLPLLCALPPRYSYRLRCSSPSSRLSPPLKPSPLLTPFPPLHPSPPPPPPFPRTTTPVYRPPLMPQTLSVPPAPSSSPPPSPNPAPPPPSSSLPLSIGP